jgi:hypothetical protein
MIPRTFSPRLVTLPTELPRHTLLLLLLLSVIIFLQGIYNYMSQTNHDPRVRSAAATL